MGTLSEEQAAYDPAETAGPGHVVDYDLDDAFYVDTREKLRALGNVTREEVLVLLSEKAATVSQLAVTIGKPKGSVGYHVKVLEAAGFVRIVRTNKVRAMTEKYYGRTARTFVFDQVEGDDPFTMLTDVRNEAVITEGERLPMFTMRRARISEARAVEFSQRLFDLTEEFLALPREGDHMYGLIAGVYATNLPAFADEGEGSDGE